MVKITAGADHIIFLTENGEVYTAGNSEHGQLGRISKYNSYRGGRRGFGKYELRWRLSGVPLMTDEMSCAF